MKYGEVTLGQLIQCLGDDEFEYTAHNGNECLITSPLSLAAFAFETHECIIAQVDEVNGTYGLKWADDGYTIGEPLYQFYDFHFVGHSG